MAGNVSEMTSNLVGRELAEGDLEPTDEIVIRGGNFVENKESLQTTYRWAVRLKDGGMDSLGFRCVVSVKEWKARKK